MTDLAYFVTNLSQKGTIEPVRPALVGSGIIAKSYERIIIAALIAMSQQFPV